MAVLIIIILVPIIIFGSTFFITSSVSRYDAQTRSMKALYLAQAGIHRAIFNIKSTGTPLPVANWDVNNQIAVTLVAQCSNIYQLKSIGTSIANGNAISRTVFAQYDNSATKVTLYLEGDGTGIPPPVCCDQIWWPFSEGSGITTGTPPYQGALVNSPPWVAGRIGTALLFNTTLAHRYVTVLDSPGLDLTTEGTLMAWIYITAQVNDNAGIVHKGDRSNSSDEAYALVIDRVGANRRIRILLRDAGGTERGVTENTNLDLNTWYHVAGTWGASGMRLYLNGNPVNFNSTVRVARSTVGDLQIGTRVTNDATPRFIGTIDEVYIHACQKTAQEILDYYNATKP